ncbi:MAG: ribosome recycling factor [Erysipelotrichia bacterium]|jgi:ribosome recycling factor|nr:ribosome recycling factor [Erysipelotrichia bacterium]
MKKHLDVAHDKMKKTVDAFYHALSTLRTGRANPTLISEINVDYYGMPTPLSQLGQINVVEGKQLVFKPFDNSVLKDTEKAIFNANIGLTPQNDGIVIRVNVPSLTQETRKEIAKQVSKLAEEAKVAARNVRREINDHIKADEEISEDVEKKALDQVQKLTDETIKSIDSIASDKTKEIMTV